jgi:hypothetical protein
MDDGFNFPNNLPPLPPNPYVWSASALQAHQVLDSAYTRALETLRREASEGVRYKLLSSNIVNNMVPILERTEEDGVPREWVNNCAENLGPLVYELEVAALAAEGLCVKT